MMFYNPLFVEQLSPTKHRRFSMTSRRDPKQSQRAFCAALRLADTRLPSAIKLIILFHLHWQF